MIWTPILRTRKWAHEHMRRGTFGSVTVDSCGVLFADLAAVESRLGGPITPAQLARRGVTRTRLGAGRVASLTLRLIANLIDFQVAN